MLTSTIPLAVRICGSVGPPPVVFLHSIGCDGDMWRDQAIRFQARHCLICVDLPGHGCSAEIEAAPDMQDYAAKVAETLDTLGTGACDLVGLSLGGMVAAAFSLDRPDRARRLAICDARLDAPSDYQSMWDRLLTMVTNEGMDAVAEYM